MPIRRYSVACRLAAGLTLLLGFVLLPTVQASADYPDRIIKLVVPHADYGEAGQ
jgi:hypothetical protein